MHDFDQYFATRRYLDLTVHPDGDEVAYATDISGQFNVWTQSRLGGWPYQLTTFEQRSVRRVAWSPDGRLIAFAADCDGNENDQVHVIPAAGGMPARLTRLDRVKYRLGVSPWSPDGGTLACSCNADDPANFDLVIIDVATGATRRCSSEPLMHEANCWSRDGRMLCGTAWHANLHQDVVLVDTETGQLRCPTRDRPVAIRTPLGFSADGSSLYLLSDEGREFKGIARLDTESGDLDWVRTPDHDIDLASMSADNRWILYVVNEDSSHRVHLYDRNKGFEPDLPPLPMGRVLGLAIAADGNQAAILHSASRHPPEVVVFELPRGATDTITHGMIGAIPETEMVEPTRVRYRSFDRKIPALLYRPPGDPPEGGFPALMHIHGGPERQVQPEYLPLFQFLLSRGFVILAPNIRGSTGYGKSYQQAIHRDFGGDDLRDLEAAAQYLCTLPFVDDHHLAVAGASYGGFATLLCATRLPDYWAAAVDICGPGNLVTFAKTVPEWWRRFLRDWVGDPDSEERELLRRSPVTYLDNLRCPLLVIQGAQDPRVKQSESDEIVARIRERGGTVDYLVFQDEGHHFLKRSNQRRKTRTMADFLLRHAGKDLPCEN